MSLIIENLPKYLWLQERGASIGEVAQIMLVDDRKVQRPAGARRRSGSLELKQLDKAYDELELLRQGWSAEKVATVMVADERDRLIDAEHDPDAHDRAIVETAVSYGAKQLGVTPPRVRFFGSSAAFDGGGITYKSHPHEIWVRGDLPWYAMGELALHELAHTQHFLDGTPADVREIDARRFVDRGRRWVQEAARVVASRDD